MLRLRYLHLRAITRTRQFAADVPFSRGLNILRAGNTSGKSTCLQAIVYALGLERSLGPQLQVPLPYAMRERIHQRRDDDYEPVLASYVELEIENSNAEILVVRRDITGGKDPKLVQTWSAPKLSKRSATGHRRDFFIHDPGAAQREDGFHHHLAQFIGWELPEVPRFDGGEGPLYLEAIFPMLFVEQKRGWSTIQGPFPTFLRIQDVIRRVMEFLLDLEAGRIRRERAEINRLLSNAQQRWRERKSVLEEQAGRLVRLRGIPPTPSAEFFHAPEATIEVLEDDEWRSINDVIDELARQLRDLEGRELPTADAAASEIEQRLVAARESVDQLTAMLEAFRDEYNSQLQDHRAIESRLNALDADLKRNQDALKLRGLGSELGHASGESVCPTCHQSVSSELLPVVGRAGMGLEENIGFVRSQIELYRAALASCIEKERDISARFYAAQQKLRDKQHEVRGLRQALVQPSSAPSRAILEEIVRRQTFLDHLQSVRESVDSLMDELRSITSEWVELQDRMKRLSTADLTPNDLEKIDDFQSTIQRHLGRYGFRSFQPNEIKLSADNFRPLIRREEDGETIEKEINFEVSASDAIRLKWAYYLALLSISRRRTTNHCGLVIFDEPGQQEIEISSLQALFQWSARSLDDNQQLVIATSESLVALHEILGSSSVNLITFDGFILQPLP
jgi:hypothetical protein